MSKAKPKKKSPPCVWVIEQRGPGWNGWGAYATTYPTRGTAELHAKHALESNPQWRFRVAKYVREG